LSVVRTIKTKTYSLAEFTESTENGVVIFVVGKTIESKTIFTTGTEDTEFGRKL